MGARLKAVKKAIGSEVRVLHQILRRAGIPRQALRRARDGRIVHERDGLEGFRRVARHPVLGHSSPPMHPALSPGVCLSWALLQSRARTVPTGPQGAETGQVTQKNKVYIPPWGGLLPAPAVSEAEGLSTCQHVPRYRQAWGLAPISANL